MNWKRVILVAAGFGAEPFFVPLYFTRLLRALSDKISAMEETKCR
jgi:hypothetical protein